MLAKCAKLVKFDISEIVIAENEAPDSMLILYSGRAIAWKKRQKAGQPKWNVILQSGKRAAPASIFMLK
jgi:hypothetical protein